MAAFSRTLLGAALALFPTLALAAPTPVDRIVAVVDDDPILESDLRRVIGLGLVEKKPEESEEAFRRRVLDGLIEEKLRFHAVDQFGFGEIPVEQVESKVAEIRDRFPDVESFRKRLADLNMSEQDLRQLVARQLLVLTYVDERLGAKVFVSLDDIRTYYDQTLVPELRRRGARVPPIEEVREQIREVLRQQRLNQEIADWTAELRREADVADYVDSRHQTLPPVVAGEPTPP